jgi:DHA1 family bicyclomycin/chloramphenicol resistance-like MFS transporter
VNDGGSSRIRWRSGGKPWVLTLAAVTAVTALSIDMSLPAQPAISREFDVRSDVAQLTLSLFLVGFASSQIVFGSLSDAFGRLRVLLAGFALFTVASAACAVSPAVEGLLAARFLQGVGASAGPVIARAMVRDTQATSAAARTLSTIVSVLAIAPMVAPMIGAALLDWFGWPAIFAAHGCLGVTLSALAAFTLSETLPPEKRYALSFEALRRGLARYFGTRATRVPTALICLGFIGQFSFISNSPFVLIEGYGVTPEHFSLYFGATAFALMIGSIIGRRLLQYHAPVRVLSIGAIGLCTGGLMMLVGVSAPVLGAAGIVAPMIVYCTGVGMAFPSSIALALDPVAEIAGLASAIIGSLQMFSGALAGYVVTRIGGRDPHTLAAVVASAGVLAALLAFYEARAMQRQGDTV